MRSNGLTLIGLSVLLAASGCHKRTPIATAPTTGPSTTSRDPAPAPASAVPAVPTPPPVPTLEMANRAFISGSYDDAARAYETYLKVAPTGADRDQALFHLGLIYVLRPAPANDWQRATAAFKQLVDEYPTSPLRAPANLILSLRAELDQITADSKQRDLKIKQLTTELDRLKKIDADRRKRP